jgi:hypothetical protein
MSQIYESQSRQQLITVMLSVSPKWALNPLIKSTTFDRMVVPIWAAFLCGYALLHPYLLPTKKRTTPRCSIVVHVFRGAAIL